MESRRTGPSLNRPTDAGGAMVHCDTKKLGRIVVGLGIAFTGTTAGDTARGGRCSTWPSTTPVDWSTRMLRRERQDRSPLPDPCRSLVSGARHQRRPAAHRQRQSVSLEGLAEGLAPLSCATVSLAPTTPKPTATPSAGSAPCSASASTSRPSRTQSTAATASLASSSGTTCIGLTMPWKGSVRVLVSLSCRRRECYQPRER